MNNFDSTEIKPLDNIAEPSQRPSKEKGGQDVKPVKFLSLFQFASAKDKILMIIGTLAAIANGAVISIFSLFFGDITDTLAEDNDVIFNAGMISLQFFGLAIGSWILSYISFAFWMIAGERQGIEIRKRYFRSLLRQEIAFFDEINPNELSSRIASECFDIQGGIGEKVVTFIYSLSMFISGLLIGYIKGWQLALVLTSIIPLIVAAGTAFIYSIQKQTTFNAKCYEEAGGISEEALNAIKTVVSLCGEEKETKCYMLALTKHKKSIAMFAIFSGVAMGVMMFMMIAMYALGFWYGSKLIEDGTTNAISNKPYTGGDVLTVFFSIMMAGFSLSQAGPAMKKFALAKAAGAKAFPIIFRQSKISIESQEGLKPSSIQGYVEFKAVTFAYPLRPDNIVLDCISFKANRNEKIALVGESGCGKTTCLQLLERFYDCQKGSIMIDGNDIKTLNLRWLRENIGYVGQEPVLFATSIKENLLIAKEDATDQELWDALQKANADDFVKLLPQKLDTFVGTNATQLSGGQKQRLAIARAILKNPSILILDEATSALDRKNEREIQKTLDEISEGRTTITIAHRLTTVQNADRIFVFEKGKVVEEGQHNELIMRRGVYYALQHLQLQTEDQNEEDLKQEGKSKKRVNQENDLEIPNERPEKNVVVSEPSDKEQNLKIKENNGEDATNSVSLKIGDDKDNESMPKPKTKQNASHKKDKITSRLIAYNKEASWLLVLGVIFAALNGTVFPLNAIVLAKMLELFAFPDAEDFNDRATKYSLYFLALSGGAFVFSALQLILLNLVGENLSKKLRIAVFKKYLSMEIGWYDLPENAPGALCAKLATDANLVNSLASVLLGVFAQALSSFITGTIVAFIASWQLTLVSLAVSPLTVIGGSIEAKFNAGFSAADDKAYNESSNFVSEAVNNMRTVASFAREDKLLKSYGLKLQEPLRSAIRKGNLSGLAYGFSQFTFFFVFAVIFLIGAVFVVKINLGYGDLFQSIMGIFFAAYGAGNSMQYAPDVGAAKAAALSIFKILDRQPTIKLDALNQNIRTPIKGDIEFKNIWFRYPTRPKDVLKGVSFKISAGSNVAFVGPSGCGKSTIMSLLQRFYDPIQGEILIDGIDIKKYNLHHLRSTFGVVSQEPTLFNGTIEYNIRYNQEKVDFEEIRQAAAEANALGFIERNEFDDPAVSHSLENNNSNHKGFNKNVGPKGSQISGGQKQRIAIARAILKKPSVLLLDEATSALDAQSEKVVQESLDSIMKGKTAIIIAHRISTIRGTDEILVFNDGEVIETGNYEQLVQKKGIFYKLERGLDLNE